MKHLNLYFVTHIHFRTPCSTTPHVVFNAFTDQTFKLCNVVLTIEPVDEIQRSDYSNESNAFQWCCSLCFKKVVLAFESVDEILMCFHSNDSVSQY